MLYKKISVDVFFGPDLSPSLLLSALVANIELIGQTVPGLLMPGLEVKLTVTAGTSTASCAGHTDRD